MKSLRTLSFAAIVAALIAPVAVAYTPAAPTISGPLTNGDCVSVANSLANTIADAGGSCTPNAVLVANPSGSSTGDTQSIDSAVAAAGSGGTVVFPPNKTYLVGECGKGWPGSHSINPAKVDLNGSTIKLTSGYVFTIATGNVASGATTITVASASSFCVGDEIIVRDPYGSGANWTYPSEITHIAGNVLTVGSLNFGSGGPTVSGNPIVERVDYTLYFSGTTPIRITGGTFDGNSSNRNGQTQVWGYGDCVMVPNTNSRVVFDHNTVQNCLVSGFGYDNANWADIESNYFSNIAGNGEWSGGQGVNAFDQVVTDNVFSNVFQFTNLTAPTATQFGHTFSQGAMASSLGPQRLTVSGNVVDTSKGFCVGNPGNATDIHYVISGNIFYHCDMGGFEVAGSAGGFVSITGNEIVASGHEASYVSGDAETTNINTQGAASNVNVTGNLFYDSVFDVFGPSPGVTISGNLFYDPDLTNVHHVTNVNVVAALLVNGAVNPSVLGTLAVTGNTFVLPSGNVTDELDAIDWNYCAHGVISGNEISGGWVGVRLEHTITDLAISGNDIINQSNNNSSFTGAAAISADSTLVAANLSISGNTVGLDLAGTVAWTGINLGNSSTYTNTLVSSNSIYSNQTPSTSQQGIGFGSSAAAGIATVGNSISLASGNAINASNAGSSAIFSGNIARNGSLNYGSNIWPEKTVTGRGSLSSGTLTISLSGANAFTSLSTYNCSGSDTTTPVDAVGFQPQSGTSLKATGNANDNFSYQCVGY